MASTDDKMTTKGGPLGEGFTWRVILAVVYAAVVLLPAHLWLQLSSGVMLDLGLRYATLLLFVEVARIWRAPLSKQETFLIWAMASQVAWETGLFAFPMGMIYRAWYATSPVAQAFGLMDQVPTWWAPLHSRNILIMRTFFNTEWIMPMALTLLAGALWRLTDLTMGYICRQIYVVTENLPFPMARIGADVSLVLTDRPPNLMKTLVLTAVIAQFYSLFIFIPRIVYGATVIPYPWIDFTGFIEKTAPGASFAISTDPISLVLGLIMPFNAVASMFLGSFSLYFIGNWLTSPASPFGMTRGIFSDWVYGMQAGEAYTRSMLFVWASVLIGLGLAAGLIPIIRRPRTLVRSFQALFKSGRSETGMSIWVLLGIFFAATGGSALLVHLLVPDFPLYILILLSVVWVFIINLVAARSLGEIGTSLDLNSLYVIQGAFTAFSPGSQIWFGGSYLVTTSYGAGWCQNFKICEMTGTSISSYVKAYFFTFILATIMAFVYSQALWNIAPIPSSVYPWANVQFPVNAQWFSLWASKSLSLFNVPAILGSLGLASVVYLICGVLHLPFSVMGFAIGATSFIGGVTTALLGAVAGLVLQRIAGREWWDQNKGVIAAGLTLGEGVVVAIATAIAIIQKSIWVLPF